MQLNFDTFYSSSITGNIKEPKVIVMGAGPAGLTAAYELSEAGIESVVVEKDNTVGGISRTVN